MWTMQPHSCAHSGLASAGGTASGCTAAKERRWRCGLPLWLRPFEVRGSRRRVHSLPCSVCVELVRCMLRTHAVRTAAHA